MSNITKIGKTNHLTYVKTNIFCSKDKTPVLQITNDKVYFPTLSTNSSVYTRN